MSNTQVFLAQKYDDLPLVVGDLVGILSLKLVDKLNEVAVTVFAKVLRAQVCQLILALDVVNADLTLLHHFLQDKYLSTTCFARGLQVRLPATCSANVLSIHDGAPPTLPSKPSSSIMLDQNAASSIVRASPTSSASIVDCAVVDCAVSPCSPTMKMI